MKPCCQNNAGSTYCPECGAKLKFSDDEKARLNKARAWLEVNFSTASFVDAAKQAHYSRFHFHRMFRVLFGITPKAFCDDLKIAESRRLILNGVALADVADRCGFAHQTHFTARFKQLTGQTPTQWLKTERSKAA